VVLKPSEITPRHAHPLAALLASVPEIAAVTRVVLGPGRTGADLIDHADAVVLTGSVRTGRLVAEHAARRFIPAFLELGGKDAVIVTAGADLDRAATTILRASVLATGQACQSLERVYVARQVLAPLLAKLRARLPAVRLTCDDPQGHIGPFIMADQARIVREHIADAVARGAQLESGGRIIERGGSWCEPTLLTAVDHSMRVMREETFGPVMPVMPFDSTDEAVALANDSEYGLSANVLAADEDEALAIARRLDAGFVSINDISMSSMVSDFEWEGFRFSGLGRSRMGPAGIARYLRTKAIVVNRGPTADITALTDL
jgi:acyl-CoA reductase-like NAD-dependent aldehyde dehydrogenase